MKAARYFLAFLILGISLCAAARPGNGFGIDFDGLRRSLHLRSEQREQFDAAVAATQRALLAVALSGMQLKQGLEEELSKPKPDLGALARAQDQLFEDTRPLFREAGEAWRKLYTALDDGQVAIAKSFIEENLGRLLK